MRPSEVRLIPCVDRVDDLPRWVPEGARILVGFGMTMGNATPCKQLSVGRKQLREMGRPTEGWTVAMRDRVARQVEYIKHWRIIEGDYSLAPNRKATWFVDPPYNNEAGAH